MAGICEFNHSSFRWYKVVDPSKPYKISIQKKTVILIRHESITYKNGEISQLITDGSFAWHPMQYNFLSHPWTWQPWYQFVSYIRTSHTNIPILNNIEGTWSALNKLSSSLEPSLVAGLRLANVKLSVCDSRCYQLVFATFSSTSRSGQDGNTVVLLTANNWCGGF